MASLFRIVIPDVCTYELLPHRMDWSERFHRVGGTNGVYQLQSPYCIMLILINLSSPFFPPFTLCLND